jgi:dihydrodipicolinate synthase/N-acetylneuraminate lyase
MGVIDTPEMRLPLVPLAEPLAVELRRKLQAKGLAR